MRHSPRWCRVRGEDGYWLAAPPPLATAPVWCVVVAGLDSSISGRAPWSPWNKKRHLGAPLLLEQDKMQPIAARRGGRARPHCCVGRQGPDPLVRPSSSSRTRPCSWMDPSPSCRRLRTFRAMGNSLRITGPSGTPPTHTSSSGTPTIARMRTHCWDYTSHSPRRCLLLHPPSRCRRERQ